jgi:biopolymer transport protein ExbB/TolQ
MPVPLIGLAIGLVVAIANYLALMRLSARVSKPETRKVLKIVALLDLIIMPALGWWIGTIIEQGTL